MALWSAISSLQTSCTAVRFVDWIVCVQPFTVVASSRAGLGARSTLPWARAPRGRCFGARPASSRARSARRSNPVGGGRTATRPRACVEGVVDSQLCGIAPTSMTVAPGPDPYASQGTSAPQRPGSGLRRPTADAVDAPRRDPGSATAPAPTPTRAARSAATPRCLVEFADPGAGLFERASCKRRCTSARGPRATEHRVVCCSVVQDA